MTGETCTVCWEQVDAVHESGLCPKCVRDEQRRKRSRRREARQAAAVLPGQLDLLELLDGEAMA